MQAIFLDGEAKSGKTTVGNAIREALAGDYRVHSAVRGAFFRRLVVLALEINQGKPIPTDTSWLDEALKDAIASDMAYDEDRDWSTIESAEVSGLVAVAGQYAFVQAAANEWDVRTANHALMEDAEILLIDGRNPRAKLSAWCKTNNVPTALDLCIHCDDEVAGARLLMSRGIAKPTKAQLEEATQNIRSRRQMDRTRLHSPYVAPADQLEFMPERDSAEEVIKRSFADTVTDPPRVIGFDTSRSSVEHTRPLVSALAKAAAAFPKTS
jgi:cytidylate kinase